jgi:cellulose synthase/poly-beta-1,6-N-acetylglucosamine synthase-like glycosyltransferase
MDIPQRDVDISALIIIPAHNEEEGITRTVQSIKDATSGLEQTEIYVLADHCDDQTDLYAKKAGAHVVKREQQSKRGKGAALDWFVHCQSEQLKRFRYTIIIDADTEVKTDFLTKGIHTLEEQNVDVLQLHYSSKLKMNYSTGQHALELSNHCRQKGLFTMLQQALLKGNGMIFKTEVLLKEGYASNSIAEDLDFSYHLISNGYQIGYSDHSSVYGDMPESGDAFMVQHQRWEGGRSQILKSWLPKLLIFAIKQKKLSFLFLAIDLSVPPLVPLLIFLGILFPISIFTDMLLFWSVQLILISSYVWAAPRWHIICYPKPSDIVKIAGYIWLKLKVIKERILTGDPKTFIRTPRNK